jgi:CheY-like chemotaxis protein
MDLQMPTMTGTDAITAIRDEFPAARIVVLTAYKGDVRRCAHSKPALWVTC